MLVRDETNRNSNDKPNHDDTMSIGASHKNMFYDFQALQSILKVRDESDWNAKNGSEQGGNSEDKFD